MFVLFFCEIPQIYNIHTNHTRLSLQSTQIYMLLLTYCTHTYITPFLPSLGKVYIHTDIHLNYLTLPWVVGTDRYAYKSETGAS